MAQGVAIGYRVNPELKAELDVAVQEHLENGLADQIRELHKDKTLTRVQLQTAIVEHIIQQGLRSAGSIFTETELKEIQDAAASMGITEAAIIKKGALLEARTVNSNSDQLVKYETLSYAELEKLLDKDEEMRGGKTLRGMATLKIRKFVEFVTDYNSRPPGLDDPLFINLALIYNGTNSNRVSIKSWLEANKAEVDRLNALAGFPEGHEEKKQPNATNLRSRLGLEVKA